MPYSSPIATSNYPFLGITFTGTGLALMGFYFVIQMRESAKQSVVLELLIGLVASVALGFGTLFMMLSFGLYV